MQIKSVTIMPYIDDVLLTIAVDSKDGIHLQNIVNDIGDLNGEYDVKITKRKQKRSKDQNAYMWELLGQMAIKLRTTDKDLYRDFVKDYGVSMPMAVRDKDLDGFMDYWNGKGVGWFCENLGECRNVKGAHTVKAYIGSSQYDKDQMRRLLDAVVDECQTLGIETLTPHEIDLMMKGEVK